ncbi:hypothetical protein DL93DRAFT_2077585 [Clavulina sp. PMI_390]|nr:hypothetical protein DL93DRAFT_2077585 [Clavulina sp. PMI_390]
MPSGEELRPGSAASMLYLARVLRVEDTSDSQEAANQSTDKKWPLPLLYHRKTYTTVGSAN